jgi:hypothetical protein
MKAGKSNNCKIRQYISASDEEIAKIKPDSQSDYYMGQLLPDRSSIPNCPECASDKVAGIFYGSTPSGGHDGVGGAITPDYHPCREFATSMRQKNIILQIDAGIDYTIISRPMWHCDDCGTNFNN